MALSGGPAEAVVLCAFLSVGQRLVGFVDPHKLLVCAFGFVPVRMPFPSQLPIRLEENLVKRVFTTARTTCASNVHVNEKAGHATFSRNDKTGAVNRPTG